ncbi:MAG TPA: hypothetical protein DDW56_27395 [Cyanobacteria bacterium UBA11366]|nr:hypothetical protein [Cyanobacteria bacterium UBA11366]HBK64168.1 hypothetical protein [Cyanobacteria bacterium UBA11166]
MGVKFKEHDSVLELPKLVEGINTKNQKKSESTFRNKLYQEIVNFVVKQPEDKRMNLLEELRLMMHDKEASQGRLFTEFRNETMEEGLTRNKDNSRTLNQDGIDNKRRNADDVITVDKELKEEGSDAIKEGSPPMGNYLVEDKAGDSFTTKSSEQQLENYQKHLAKGDKIETKIDNEKRIAGTYDGVIYFFDSENSALNAMDKIQNMHPKIYVGYYNEKAQLTWMPRSTKKSNNLDK